MSPASETESLQMNNIHTLQTESAAEDLSGLLTPSNPPAPSTQMPPNAENSDGLPSQLAELLRAIKPSGLQDFMRTLFVEIRQLLASVEGIRNDLQKGTPLEELCQHFEALRKPSYYLLTNIETAELRIEGLPDRLVEPLEAASFALSHELTRVFKKEPGVGMPAHSEPQRNILQDCALLENCFQQLTIGLARSFDASMSGVRLYENYRKRREESVELLREMRGLLLEIRALQKEYSLLSGLGLLKVLRRFRYECLHYLMYRDWEDFERFVDALELSYESEGEMKVLLHKMSCYVEALLNQVKMRAVLTEKADA